MPQRIDYKNLHRRRGGKGPPVCLRGENRKCRRKSGRQDDHVAHPAKVSKGRGGNKTHKIWTEYSKRTFKTRSTNELPKKMDSKNVSRGSGDEENETFRGNFFGNAKSSMRHGRRLWNYTGKDLGRVRGKRALRTARKREV